MNWKRVLLKLRFDSPRALAAKLLHRVRARRATLRRRARWSGGRLPVSPGDMPALWSPDAASGLWPGATDRSWLAGAVQRWPDLHAQAARRAAAAAQGRFDLLGSGDTDVRDNEGHLRWHQDFKSGVDFPADSLYLDVPICLEREGTDIKVPWELSRFQHVFAFLWTEPDRYCDVFLRQWNDWLQANPVARGPNWACTMDVALRAISWTAALAAWAPSFDESTLRRMWASLACHGHFIRDNLEWAPIARTNHYFSDIVGLAVLGAVLGPYPPARAWAAFAAQELSREIRQQFAPDGFNKECSTTYHGLMVELATLGVRACAVSGRELGADVGARLVAAYRAIDILCDTSGTIPLIGDNDSSRVFPLAQRADTELRPVLALGAAVLGIEDLAVADAAPEVALLCGPAALQPNRSTPLSRRLPAGRALPDSGLFVLGSGGDHLVVRCGPLTYRPVGSHNHIDQLSFTVSVDGRPMLVDPGQYCYTPSPTWRNHFIDSRAHNTVTVDDQPQCRMFTLGWMSFSVIAEARPRCEVWEADAQRARFVGRHCGYRRLHGGADHERAIIYEAGARCWTVTDRLPLAGRHRVEWRFCLHPDVAVEPRAGVWHLRCGQVILTLRSVEPTAFRGTVESGWYAPAYGCKVATQVLQFAAAVAGPAAATFVLQVQNSGR